MTALPHDLFTLCIQEGMPGGFSSGEQTKWLKDYISRLRRKTEEAHHIKQRFCDIVPGLISRSWEDIWERVRDKFQEQSPNPTEPEVRTVPDNELPSLRDLVGLFAVPKPKPKFAISTDEEYFYGEYESIEDAVQEATHGHGYEVFFVGECIAPRQPEEYWDAEDWLEHVSCQDVYGSDCAEDWDDSSQEDREELEEEVRQVMAEWLDRKKLRPKFFVIDDPIKYVVRYGQAIKVGTEE